MFRLYCLLLFLTLHLFAATQKEVLLLHSYHKGYKWSDDISNAIEEKLEHRKDINISTVYMDTKKIDTPLYYSTLLSLFKQQFENRRFDLILASDNNALDFLNQHQEELFPNTPILFCGINNFNREMISNLNKVSGVVEQVDLKGNFKLISQLHPHLKKLIIINDHSKTGLGIKKDLQPLIKEYSKKFTIEYLDDMDMNQLKNKVSKESQDTVLLFVLLFKDKTGEFFTYKQSLKHIKSISDVPIYGLWDFYLNMGVIGGLVTSAKAQGEAVAQMAIEVLDNNNINDIPILQKSPNRYIFDYHELKRFGIDISQSLDEYKVINEPITIYKQHRNFVVLTLLIILILFIIVLIMRANIQRRKKLEKDLSNRIKFDKVLLDTLPNPIYYKNTDGKLLGCNLSFSKLFNTPKEEVVGKTAFDFFPEEIAAKNVQVDKELLKTFGIKTSELTLHFNDRMRYFILNKAAYESIDGSVGGIVCIMDDITERVQQKQFLIQQSKLAEMGDMVAAIAHQWNEPLVELSAQVQDIALSHQLNELKSEQMNAFVHDSMVQIQYMSKTLSDFRNFLKPSTKKQLFSIEKCLNEIFEIIGKQIFYSNIHLHIEYVNKNEDLLIYGYENEFKQVLLNIINNAKNKIMELGLGANEKKNITIKIYSTNHYNIIEIADNAGEIPANIIGNIFDPYFTTKKQGTGFGLYMAKVIIEDKMQGKIRVKNDNHQVVFTIKMPNQYRE
ncbi:ABC transporter substrate binding protein [Candidatus Marinarcus aquaticus]|uniref:Histidine kinase n=1 Tax=Candidatus Marinarcus aquaticus TaxID=2044504 RepID=A0A4Q0XQH6_9BACT|nr:ABC transporter substrate binding protein [Candidatus Marinarcus aquaticus]RXJ58019.1 histidine kinase [Candidatus Marinarcus aquaticus]